MKDRFVIIDGNAILHRAWHAMPPLQTKDGRIVSAAYGFTTMLMKVIKDLKPSHFAVTFDLKGATFRHDAFEAYKAHRVAQPQELYDQIPMVKDVLEGFRLPVFEAPGFEADDVIGTLSKKAPKGVEVIIVTGDLDTLQLVDDRTRVYTLRKGMSDIVIYDEAAVFTRYGLRPDQLIDYKAMRGDPSDNLPGLHGIGEKGGSELLQKYHTIEGIYEAVRKDPNSFKPRVLTALIDGEKDVPLSKKLVTIVRDVKIPFDFKKTAMQAPDLEKLRKAFMEYEFKTLLPKVEREMAPREKAKGKKGAKGEKGGTEKPAKQLKAATADIVSGDALLKTFGGSEAIAVRFAYDRQDRIDPMFFGVAVSDGANCQVSLADNGKLTSDVVKLLSSKARKIVHDSKDDLVAMAAAGEFVRGDIDDTMLMSYILSPGSRAHKLSDLIFEETGRTLSTQASLFAEERAAGMCAEASQIFALSKKLAAKLKEEKLDTLYEGIERPLMPVLAAMERHGIKVNAPFLNKMGVQMKKRIDELTKAIVEAAGEEFNINSPAQLGKILFEVLRLPTQGIKKTGTGQLSTGADELEKLRGAHPIVGHIFEHRELSKLLSTYVSAIPSLIHPKSGRLHTHFNQAVAATGRLSSTEPNLQNIPIRTEAGREIRKAFVADKGHVLVAADYSQIELRIAASIADDKEMIQAFRRGDDIHTITAAKIWDTPPEKVAFEQRRAAKAINFGILYGMGANALASSAGVSRDEARVFIQKYLSVYSGLKKYMDEAKAQAKSLGYVETLFGRRRFLPEIHSGVPFVRAEAERMAINMPIQGTSADIIKMAMIKLHDRIAKEYGLGDDADVKMLLQVHDELVFEVRDKLVGSVIPWIRKAMEGVAELKVPLDVEVEMGQSWGDMQSI